MTMEGHSNGLRRHSLGSNQPSNGRHHLMEHPTIRDIDALIAQEMTQMSIQDREKALDDVHCVGKKEEDPNLDNWLLLQLENHLSMTKRGTVYEEAEQLSAEYVRNRHFRLMFLRSEYSRPEQAAERMLRFFELKKRLFGSGKLVREITLNELNDDDMATLMAGEGQISPLKDASGRCIVLFMQSLRQYQVVENLQRAMFYVFMASMESTTAQNQGLVGIFYNVDSPSLESVNSELRNSLPVHFAALHLCLNDPAKYAKACKAILPLTTLNRARYRLHFGSHADCLYELVTFGIPREAVPVSESGHYSTEQHLEWIEERRHREVPLVESSFVRAPLSESPSPLLPPSYMSPSSVSTCSIDETDLRPNDVLFGRGKTVVDRPGNVRFRRLIDVYMVREESVFVFQVDRIAHFSEVPPMQQRKYEEAGKLEKTCIAEAITHMIHESSGRFLKKKSGVGWEEVEAAEARRKVAHAFRNRRKFHEPGET